ncbi:MAG: hypothetical protein QXQ66_08440 [Candidatus Hadarchaeum sp.]
MKKRYRVWLTTPEGFDLVLETFSEDAEAAKKECERKGVIRHVVEVK